MQEMVKGIAATASAEFNSSVLDSIQGIENAKDDEYVSTVKKLMRIKKMNPNVKYAYIQRKTQDPNTLIFVADADALYPDKPIDKNNNGTIDEDEELSLPGNLYDVSNYPRFIKIAFTEVYVDDILSVDQWGTHLSATSPIFEDGLENTDYLIGVDVDVSDYVKSTNAALIPFATFVVVLLMILSGLTISLVKMWGGRVELLKELDRQKDELLSIVSHQLATPVSSVRWYVEMMLDGDLGEISKEQREHLVSVQGVAANLSDLVGMILDVSRIQLGKMKVEPGPMDLNAFFKEILEVIEPKAKQKETNFNVKVDQNLPTVLLDKRLTRMTVENLLSNAVKYTPSKGKVDFLVEKRGEKLYCEVRDTGCGIPKADQGKIFGKMYRASNVVNSVDGNGFGLYIAKGAIEGQDGKIWFESEENKGTAFFIELPLKAPPTEQVAKAA